jgi:4-diphosphocytidyl-2-C-methyl-D-erythritol kinase
MKLVLKAPAKINLFLEIVGRRPDGYHLLETIMQTVNLYDELSFELALSSEISLSVISGRGCGQAFEALPLDDGNIIMRAAKILKEKFGISRGVKITLEKNIPLGAGLGGGSSNAASALQALVKLWNIKISKSGLEKIAAVLGADVPFFLSGQTALCEGIGEIITPFKIRKNPLSLVLVNPCFSVPTPSVYKRVKLPFTNPHKIDKIKNLIKTGSFDLLSAKETMFNRLEDFVLSNYPEIKKIKEVLISLGCAALMSGSGATVFGIYAPQDKQKIEAELKKRSWKYWFVETI